MRIYCRYHAGVCSHAFRDGGQFRPCAIVARSLVANDTRPTNSGLFDVDAVDLNDFMGWLVGWLVAMVMNENESEFCGYSPSFIFFNGQLFFFVIHFEIKRGSGK